MGSWTTNMFAIASARLQITRSVCAKQCTHASGRPNDYSLVKIKCDPSGDQRRFSRPRIARAARVIKLAA